VPNVLLSRRWLSGSIWAFR